VARGLFVKEIGMHVENMIIIVDSYSQFNEGDLNDHIIEHENVNFVNKL
jgi:hypothetical protein